MQFGFTSGKGTTDENIHREADAREISCVEERAMDHGWPLWMLKRLLTECRGRWFGGLYGRLVRRNGL